MQACGLKTNERARHPWRGTLSTTCCIAGGGPAGMMLGLLLARAGIDVVVLEKHADFLRDFRGDTIHPSTLEVMDELGLLDDLLKLPHNKVARLGVQVGDTSINFADFTWLPPRYAFIALMPQWDFLDFLADEARKYPNFKLIMQANVVDLIEEDGRVVGVRGTTPEGPLEVRAKLTVGCDGRKSTVRAKAGLEVEDIGAPIDVFWMRISRRPGDPPIGRAPRRRQLFRHARPRRLLPARLRHPQERRRAHQGGGPAGLPRRSSPRRCRSSPTASTS